MAKCEEVRGMERRDYMFACPKCNYSVISRDEIFKCPKCGFEPEVKDYKEAFNTLMKQRSEKYTDMLTAMNIFKRESQISKNESRVLKVLVVVLFTLLIISWLI